MATKTKTKTKKDIVNTLVDIIVDRDSIKKIVIGKNGSRLKKASIRMKDMWAYYKNKTLLYGNP